MIYKSRYLVDPVIMDIGFFIRFGTGHTSITSEDFKKSSSGTKTQMTINIGKTLVNWNSTSSGVVGLILKSGTSGW